MKKFLHATPLVEKKAMVESGIILIKYFHGDNGAGLGTSHQTGWTGIVARMMHLFATTSAEQVLGKIAAVVDMQKPRTVEAAGAGLAGVKYPTGSIG